MFIYKIIIWFVYLITRPSISQIKGLENLPKNKKFFKAKPSDLWTLHLGYIVVRDGMEFYYHIVGRLWLAIRENH